MCHKINSNLDMALFSYNINAFNGVHDVTFFKNLNNLASCTLFDV